MTLHETRPGWVCILGAPLDTSNQGVTALGVSTARLIKILRPDAEVRFHYGHSSGGVRRIPTQNGGFDVTVLNCRMSPRSSPSEHILWILVLALLHRIGFRRPARQNRWLRSLLDAEIIADIRGGDSFSDIYGLSGFVSGSFPLLTASLLGCEYSMLPQTYGPFRSRVSRALARVLIRRADAILTRDRNCVPAVLELTNRAAAFCPDVAFTLEVIEPSRVSWIPEGLNLTAGMEFVGVNVSGLLYMGGYTGDNMFGLRSSYKAMMHRLIDALLEATGCTVLLMPHEFGAEREVEANSEVLHALLGRHPGRVFMLSSKLQASELKWVIGRSSFFVGSRMHACIAALSQEIPAVGLAYSDKFVGVFESAGVGEAVVDLRKADEGEVISRTLAAFNRRAELQRLLQAKMPSIHAEISRAFTDLLSR